MGQDEDTSMEGLDPRLLNFREDISLLEIILILGPHPQLFSFERLGVASGKPHFLTKASGP